MYAIRSYYDRYLNFNEIGSYVQKAEAVIFSQPA